MKKILIVCDFYYPNATSIGVCVHKVAKTLQKRNIEVHVLAFDDTTSDSQNEYESVRIFHIKGRFHERCITFGKKIGGFIGRLICAFGKIKCRVWQLLWFPLFRMDGIAVPLRYYRAISKLNEKNNYDMIVATYNPFEGMLASYLFKKRHPNILFVLYILDALSHAGTTKFISEQLNDKMGWKWEKRVFPLCDQIINLRCHEKHYQQKRYDVFRLKMVFSDIPFLEENNADNGYFDFEHIHFIYTGRILKNMNSSVVISTVFEKMSRAKPYILHYFSSGDEENIIKDFEKKTEGKIIAHGLVSHSQIPQIQKSADALVSIGTLGTEKISSKIFEYISTGGRIIHFQKDELDSATPYYKKYKNALILQESDALDINIQKIKDFLCKQYVRLSFEELKTLFPDNIPDFTVDLIMLCLLWREK